MQSQSQELPDAAEWIPLKFIQTREQPRRYFDPDKLEQLTQSIAQHGILEPLLVRPLKSNQYELVAGERRYRAALKLALARVPVVIRQLSDEEAIQLALIENLQREDLNPIEETEGVLQLLALKLKLPVEAVPALLYQMKNGLEKAGARSARNNSIPNFRATQEQEVQAVFQSLGLMSWLSFTCNRLPLLNLPPEVLEAIRCGRITYTKALAIARIKDQAQRQLLLDQAIAESLSLNQIRAAIKQLKPPSGQPSPQAQITVLHQRILKAKPWEDPQRWQQVQKLLAQLEEILEPGE
jgi:ParB family transcriptional regulator, chromosome partitioning protein